MKKNLLSFFIIISLILQTQYVSAQKVIATELIAEYNAEEMETLLLDFLGGAIDDYPISIESVLEQLGIQYSVEVYKVTYETTHPVLGTIQATGALSFPIDMVAEGEDDPTLPIAAYQHGTTFSTSGVPSHLSIEHNIGAILASSGYVTALPDYMGLGDSEGMHPYVHAKTQALAGIDLLRATRELAADFPYELTEQLFIFGYSQGGHGAMSLFHEIEMNYTDEFTVSGVAPMSGPYDMSQTQADVIWQEYSSPSYLPYILIGYRSVYPELLAGYEAPFIEEFDNFNNFEGDSDEFFQILDSYNIPRVPADMIKPDILEDFKTNPEHPLRVALRENDLYDWTPKAPVMLLGCCDDEQVMFGNTEVCYNKFVENGVANVEMIDFCELFGGFGFLGHGGCVPFCLLWGKQFFDDLRDGAVSTEETVIRENLHFYPNPAKNIVQFELPKLARAPYQLSISDITGRVVYRQNDIVTPNFTINIEDLQTGMYLVNLEGTKGSYQNKLMIY